MFKKTKKDKNIHYTLNETFGCPETPPTSCPTFLERNVHKQFKNALMAHNIIVVYGESRQGKTWMIDKYCANQYRIGCTATMDVEQIKKEMLFAVGVDVLEIEHTISQQTKTGLKSTTSVGGELLVKAGVDCESVESQEEIIKTTYPSLDFSIDAEFLAVIKKKTEDKYFVFDNFHYLDPIVQKQFCSLLKEFNYQNIKIIIVGVWKDSSKITALAPDLINRCEHVDIGSWKNEEFDDIVTLGEKALNIKIDQEIILLFKRISAHNIGIFKSYLYKFCSTFDIWETQSNNKKLFDTQKATQVADQVVNESLAPLSDRIRNLALPQRMKKDSKFMRQKIVCAILNLIVKNDTDYLQNGLPVEELMAEIEAVCKESGEESLGVSNVTQELGLIHTREENRQTKNNFIPLFFFDKSNKKLLILEPTIYQIREYNSLLITNIVNELNSIKLDEQIQLQV
jgi:hypothetical protein